MKTLAKGGILVTRFPFESQFGGEEVHTIDLMEKLTERSYEINFLGSCPILLKKLGGKKAWLYKPPVSRSSLVIFSLLSPILFLWAGFLFWLARRKWRISTVYCMSLGEKLLMTPWARNCKVVWVEHARIEKWLTKNPWRILYSYLSRRVTIIVTSNAMVKYLPFAKNVKAISCGVALEKEETLPSELEEFLGKGFCIGTVARLTVDKGVDSIDRLVQLEPDIRGVIVGSGPVKLSGNHRLKIVSNLSRGQLHILYKKLDLFILASREFDPFGMVAAEAMMAGTPTMITNKCGISFDLKNGREAIIVPAEFKEIHKEFKKLKKHPESLKTLALAGQLFAKKHYSLDRMVDEFEEVLGG